MMKGDKYYLLPAVLFSFVLSGCVVRTYTVTKERADQNLSSGNRGYLKGAQPAGEEKQRKLTREAKVLEVELHPPIKFEKQAKEKPAKKQAVEAVPEIAEEAAPAAGGNRGYLMESETPAIVQPSETVIEKYTVQKDDTLQKISDKFYGTTKKWNKIYRANKDVLKSPDRLYAGQVLNIPVESSGKAMQKPKQNPEIPKENLK